MGHSVQGSYRELKTQRKLTVIYEHLVCHFRWLNFHSKLIYLFIYDSVVLFVVAVLISVQTVDLLSHGVIARL